MARRSEVRQQGSGCPGCCSVKQILTRCCSWTAARWGHWCGSWRWMAVEASDRAIRRVFVRQSHAAARSQGRRREETAAVGAKGWWVVGTCCLGVRVSSIRDRGALLSGTMAVADWTRRVCECCLRLRRCSVCIWVFLTGGPVLFAQGLGRISTTPQCLWGIAGTTGKVQQNDGMIVYDGIGQNSSNDRSVRIR
jgi:hypothetical protein